MKGEIQNLRKQSLTGSDDRSVMAKLKTEEGRTATVCLGPQKQLSRLNLNEGDQVTIEGVRSRIDDKDVVLARRVTANGDSITNQLPRREQWQQLAGEIRSLRKIRGQGRDQQHLVAEIRADGRTRSIDLGPENELQPLDLREGDQVTVFARQGRIGDRSLLIAQKIRAEGRVLDVREATDRSLRRGSEGRSRQLR